MTTVTSTEPACCEQAHEWVFPHHLITPFTKHSILTETCRHCAVQRHNDRGVLTYETREVRAPECGRYRGMVWGPEPSGKGFDDLDLSDI